MTNPFPDELISAYLDGELSAAERARVEQAMLEDAQLRRTYNQLLALHATLQALPRTEPPTDLVGRVMQQAERGFLAPADAELPARSAAEAPGGTGKPSPSARSVPDRTRWHWRVAAGLLATTAAVTLFLLLPSQPFERRVADGPPKSPASGSVREMDNGSAAADRAIPEDHARAEVEKLDTLARPPEAPPANSALPERMDDNGVPAPGARTARLAPTAEGVTSEPAAQPVPAARGLLEDRDMSRLDSLEKGTPAGGTLERRKSETEPNRPSDEGTSAHSLFSEPARETMPGMGGAMGGAMGMPPSSGQRGRSDAPFEPAAGGVVDAEKAETAAEELRSADLGVKPSAGVALRSSRSGDRGGGSGKDTPRPTDDLAVGTGEGFLLADTAPASEQLISRLGRQETVVLLTRAAANDLGGKAPGSSAEGTKAPETVAAWTAHWLQSQPQLRIVRSETDSQQVADQTAPAPVPATGQLSLAGGPVLYVQGTAEQIRTALEQLKKQPQVHVQFVDAGRISGSSIGNGNSATLPELLQLLEQHPTPGKPVRTVDGSRPAAARSAQPADSKATPGSIKRPAPPDAFGKPLMDGMWGRGKNAVWIIFRVQPAATSPAKP